MRLAKQYGRENGLNAIRRDDPGARLGIVASGAAYQLVVQAVAALEDDGVQEFPARATGLPEGLADQVVEFEVAAHLVEGD